MSVLEVDLPTGFIVMNDTLRDYVQSRVVPSLKRAEFYGRKVVFYFSYVSIGGEWGWGGGVLLNIQGTSFLQLVG